MPKINIEEALAALEENQQARRFYGKLSLDEICDFCSVVIPEEDKGLPYCFHCGACLSLCPIEEEK